MIIVTKSFLALVEGVVGLWGWLNQDKNIKG
jgi:hypothetical protein